VAPGSAARASIPTPISPTAHQARQRLAKNRRATAVGLGEQYRIRLAARLRFDPKPIPVCSAGLAFDTAELSVALRIIWRPTKQIGCHSWHAGIWAGDDQLWRSVRECRAQQTGVDNFMLLNGLLPPFSLGQSLLFFEQARPFRRASRSLAFPYPNARSRQRHSPHSQ
jgi:hypothetical protein